MLPRASVTDYPYFFPLKKESGNRENFSFHYFMLVVAERFLTLTGVSESQVSFAVKRT